VGTLWISHVDIRYHIAQNSGEEKLWRISDFKVLVRKTLVNAQHLYYWKEKSFGKSESKLSFVKQKPIYRLLVLKKLFNANLEGLTC